MQITMGDTVMRDGKIIKITGKEEERKPKIISDTEPLFIQDINNLQDICSRCLIYLNKDLVSLTWVKNMILKKKPKLH